MKPSNCSYKPELLINVPLGMHHCPECGEMVVAGFAHPGIMEESDWEEFERLCKDDGDLEDLFND